MGSYCELEAVVVVLVVALGVADTIAQPPRARNGTKVRNRFIEAPSKANPKEKPNRINK
jgi:hypothetical protein